MKSTLPYGSSVLGSLRRQRYNGISRKNSARGEYIRGSLAVSDVRDDMRERWLRWFGHLTRRGVRRRFVRAHLGLRVVVDGEINLQKSWRLFIPCFF